MRTMYNPPAILNEGIGLVKPHCLLLNQIGHYSTMVTDLETPAMQCTNTCIIGSLTLVLSRLTFINSMHP